MTPHRDSILVGCSITRDRAFAANFVDTPQCRFCNSTKESIMHIVRECTALPEELKRPTLPLHLGPNFDITGIAEISYEHARASLVVSNPTQIPFMQWNQNTRSDFMHTWVDGSVDDQPLFFTRKADLQSLTRQAKKFLQGQCFIST